MQLSGGRKGLNDSDDMFPTTIISISNLDVLVVFPIILIIVVLHSSLSSLKLLGIFNEAFYFATHQQWECVVSELVESWLMNKPLS